MRYYLWFLIVLSSVLPGPPSILLPAAPPAEAVDRATVLLRDRVTAVEPLRFELAGRTWTGAPELSCFYARRSFAPAWSGQERLLPVADQLLSALSLAADDGLRPEDYGLAELEGAAASFRSAPDAAKRAELDLLLSNAFFAYAADLSNGRANPTRAKRKEASGSDCAAAPEAGGREAILESALAEKRVRTALLSFVPRESAYRRLREGLLRYRELSRRGEPGLIPEGPKLQLGDRGERVVRLRERLGVAAEAAGALPLPASANPDLYDEALAQAVRAFQSRNGFAEDGVVGAATFSELNRSAEDRVRQIEANLERWRWLPADLGSRYVRVNIPAFRLDAMEQDRSVLTLRVVVGKPNTSTPVLSSAMNAIQLNPSWYVPKSILEGEILPKAAKDPTFLNRLGYEMISDTRLRQRPGSSNALGKFKFVFPSPYGVYLHDTPSRSLFSRELRALSHGCVRVENPLELAVWALKTDPRWTPEEIQARLATGQEKQVKLPEAVPVHIGYWTAWAGDDGVLRFGRDVYQKDAGLIRRLEAGRQKG